MEPTRTCIGCRATAPQSELRRFVRRGEHVVEGTSPRSEGRGAYLHPRESCLDLAIRRRGFARALGATQTSEVELRALFEPDGSPAGSRTDVPTR